MTASQSSQRPEKPSPDFPLYAHSRGYWCKTHKGRKFNCGPWDDPQAALARWDEIRHKLERGENPSSNNSAPDVEWLVTEFVNSKIDQCEAGDLSPNTLGQYKLVGKWLEENMGRARLLESIGPSDFQRLRRKFPDDWSPTTVRNQVTVIRSIFKWGYDHELLDRPVRYGSNFSKPSAKRMRVHRHTQAAKVFTAREIWSMHDYASDHVRAWILLGLNAGYGNSDLSRLRVGDIDGQWLSVPRFKTGQPRKAWLWVETRQSIRRVLKNHDGGELLFTTMFGAPLVSDDGVRDAVAGEFAKLKADCGCDRKGVGFYSLRHTFETIAGETPDVSNLQVVVDHVMGHVDPSMAANYRESVSDARIKRVCAHVRSWLLDGRSKRRAAK